MFTNYCNLMQNILLEENIPYAEKKIKNNQNAYGNSKNYFSKN